MVRYEGKNLQQRTKNRTLSLSTFMIAYMFCCGLLGLLLGNFVQNQQDVLGVGIAFGLIGGVAGIIFVLFVANLNRVVDIPFKEKSFLERLLRIILIAIMATSFLFARLPYVLLMTIGVGDGSILGMPGVPSYFYFVLGCWVISMIIFILVFLLNLILIVVPSFNRVSRVTREGLKVICGILLLLLLPLTLYTQLVTTDRPWHMVEWIHIVTISVALVVEVLFLAATIRQVTEEWLPPKRAAYR